MEDIEILHESEPKIKLPKKEFDPDEYIRGKKIVDKWMDLHNFIPTNIDSTSTVSFDRVINPMHEFTIDWTYKNVKDSTIIQIYGSEQDYWTASMTTAWKFEVTTEDPFLANDYTKKLQPVIDELRGKKN